jgi:hypothetical protein
MLVSGACKLNMPSLQMPLRNGQMTGIEAQVFHRQSTDLKPAEGNFTLVNRLRVSRMIRN